MSTISTAGLSTTQTTGLSTLDIVVVSGYFVVIVAVGLYASCRTARGTVNGYFLAGRNMNFFMVGASLFVSNIGAEHFLGLAGSGAAGGIGVGAWEIIAIYSLQILGFLFLPVFLACQTRTMPEYLYKRFGGNRIRVYFSVLSLVLYVLTKSSVGLFTGALFLQQAMGWNLYLSVFGLIFIVALLTIAGGLTAVIYTDCIQFILVLVGSVVVTVLSFQEVGGFDGLWRKYPLAVVNITRENSTCTGEVHPQWDVMLRNLDDPDFPWLGFILGGVPTATWYFCTDQVIVQRGLASKNISHGQGAVIMTAFLKVLPFVLMVFPGMISRVLYTDEVACVDPDSCFKICQSRAGCSNIAFPKLVLNILPSGVRGLMMAVMIAALMSDLDSIFNSASSVFTIDIWSRVRRNASTREQMIVGRVFLIIVAGLSMAWIPLLKEMNSGQIFLYINEIINYLSPPAAAVYILAILWPRCNEKGAFWGLMSGLAVAVIRLLLVFIFPPPGACPVEPDTRPLVVSMVPYLYVAAIAFFVTIAVCVVVSYCTSPMESKYLFRTTFWTRMDVEHVETEMLPAGISDTGPCNVSPKVKEEQREVNNEECTFKLLKENKRQTENPLIDQQSSLAIHRNAEKQCDDNNVLHPNHASQTADMKTTTSCKQLVVTWLCGISSLHGDVVDDQAEKQLERDRMASSLQQHPKVKLFLHIMMFVALCFGSGWFAFWSLWKYRPTDEEVTTHGP